MPKEEITDLRNALSAFPPAVQEKVLWLRDFIWDQYPQCNELIYDNYNAVAFGWSPTEKLGHTFCSVAVYRVGYNVHLGFYWGAEIPDPKKTAIRQRQPVQVPVDRKTGRFPKGIRDTTDCRCLYQFHQ